MPNKKGKIRAVTGSMFCGKSDELIRELKKAQRYGKKKVIVFKPAIDDRNGPTVVKSHDGNSIKAIAIEKPKEIWGYIEGQGFDVVGIDEAQLMGPEIVAVCRDLRDLGYDVEIAGLNSDFRGEPFGPMPALISIANKTIWKKAFCAVCKKKNATRTQRLVDGEPADYNDPIVLIGAKEEGYEARCDEHHEVRNVPRTHNDHKR